jgi:hypothetical protein
MVFRGSTSTTLKRELQLTRYRSRLGPSIYELKIFVLTLREKAGGVGEKFVEFLLLHSLQALKSSDSRNATIVPAPEIALKQAKGRIKLKRNIKENSTLMAALRTILLSAGISTCHRNTLSAESGTNKPPSTCNLAGESSLVTQFY